MSYREFMDQVQAKLESLEEKDLRAMIMDWAAQTRAAERPLFLAKLVVPKSQVPAEVDTADLLAEIRSFGQRVQDGDYSAGWGWDDDLQEERELGDESWSDEVDDFFDELQQLAADGHFAEAAQGYRELFAALAAGEDSGLPRWGSIDVVLNTDLDEAASLYLRCVYEAAPLAERAEALYAAMDESRLFTEDIKLQQIQDCMAVPLPQVQEFLPGWIELLRRGSSTADAGHLREAIQLWRGNEGLRELARSNPAQYPEAYLEWVDALSKGQDIEALVAGVREALAAIPEDYVIRAKVAEYLGAVARVTRRPELGLEARQAAFFSDPSASRIVALLAAAWDVGSFQKTRSWAEQRLLKLVAAGGGEGALRLGWHERAKADLPLLFHLHLLAGDHAKAFAVCQEEDERPSYYAVTPGLLMQHFLMLWLSGRGEQRQLVEKLWRQRLEQTERGLTDAYNQQLHRVRHGLQFGPEQTKHYLKWCRQQVEAYVERVVGGQLRSSYGEAAQRLVAMAELYLNREEPRRAAEWVALYRNRFPRHRSFQLELAEALKKAGLKDRL